MGGLEGAEPAERMLCFNVGGSIQACNVKKPPYIGNNGEESPARRYKMNDFFSQKKLSGAPQFFSGVQEFGSRRYLFGHFRASAGAWYLRYLLYMGYNEWGADGTGRRRRFFILIIFGHVKDLNSREKTEGFKMRTAVVNIKTLTLV